MLETLYREHNTWLIGWIKHRMRCPEQACDLAHETFIRLLVKNLQQQPLRPRAYLSSIARGLMIDMIRRNDVEQAYLELLQQQPELNYPSPEIHHQNIETLVHIDKTLSRLGERSRDIFLMAQLDGVSLAEIGRRLQLSVKTVRKHYIRALTDCLLLMDEDDEVDA